jgi:hypothetical protein
MSDSVRDYLTKRGTAEHVVRGGLLGLVRGWEQTVESVAAGHKQCGDDYLNDMDERDILEGALGAAPPEERDAWAQRVRVADEKIRRHLVPTDACIWGDENARKYGYSRENQWWYYHRPVGGLY